MKGIKVGFSGIFDRMAMRYLKEKRNKKAAEPVVPPPWLAYSRGEAPKGAWDENRDSVNT
jgi:hypothetical protein